MITISHDIKTFFPHLRLGILQSPVKVERTSSELEREMQETIEELQGRLSAQGIRDMPVVKATKDAWRRLGKDPNRYRPSAESLLRRVSSGKGLYRVNNVVDCLNLTSVLTGFSICGYDRAKISGSIVMGIGRENEPYRGIGRGELNISRLPVFRDEKGAFGTPVSDSVRTSIDENTREVLFILPDFYGETSMDEAMKILNRLLTKHVDEVRPQWQLLD